MGGLPLYVSVNPCNFTGKAPLGELLEILSKSELVRIYSTLIIMKVGGKKQAMLQTIEVKVLNKNLHMYCNRSTKKDE